MLFLSKQVSLPKISLILQKMKIGQKSDIRPFSTKAFNYAFGSVMKEFEFLRKKRGCYSMTRCFGWGLFKQCTKKKLSKHFFNFTVVSNIFRAKRGNIRMVFRGLICADVRSEDFQLRRNTDMSMRTIEKACGISWLLTAKVVALNI